MTWIKQQQGADQSRYVLDDNNRFVARCNERGLCWWLGGLAGWWQAELVGRKTWRTNGELSYDQIKVQGQKIGDWSRSPWRSR